MAVIINEFEAIIDPSPKQPPEAEPGVDREPRSKQAAPGLSPMDLETVFRQRLSRLSRVIAD